METGGSGAGGRADRALNSYSCQNGSFFLTFTLIVILVYRVVYESKNLELHSLEKGRRWLTRYHSWQTASPECEAGMCVDRCASSHCRNRFSGSGRVYFPFHQGPAAVRQAGWWLAGRKAVIRPALCTWLIRAAVWLQVPSRGALVVSDTCVLALSWCWLLWIPSGQELCHLPQATEPPWWVSLAQCHAGQRCPTDNWGQWKCRLRTS